MKLLIKIASLIGWKTNYRVTAHVTNHNGAGFVTMTVDVSPWIHAGNIKEMEQYFAQQIDAKTQASNINLVMIHKL